MKKEKKRIQKEKETANHCFKESEVYFEREIPVHWGLVLSRIFCSLLLV